MPAAKGNRSTGEAACHRATENAARNTRHAGRDHPEDYEIRNVTPMITSSSMSNMIFQWPVHKRIEPAHSAP
uniref:Uncharacterized protein n=1 Tax=uncultured marine microorganism HF4000_APKG8K5 TaxID=455555 RepID=B3TB39_9ZZZZ|nr:hypothetical protein ALOHA_HF4000APKG8K5ctg1g17 [uncultured marine microorganism HF4000_APKG8K5]